MNNNVNQNTDCSTCGKCADTEETQKQMQQETSKRAKLSNVDANGNPLYTFLIYSENTPGLLSQITAVYTRRQVNIESLNVCASSTPGVHKFTVTSYCTEEMAKMLTKQMEKRIEVLRASYYTDDEIFIK